VKLVSYLGCRFEDLFEVGLIDGETGAEQVVKHHLLFKLREG